MELPSLSCYLVTQKNFFTAVFQLVFSIINIDCLQISFGTLLLNSTQLHFASERNFTQVKVAQQ